MLLAMIGAHLNIDCRGVDDCPASILFPHGSLFALAVAD
jgi:hypothetical protein